MAANGLAVVDMFHDFGPDARVAIPMGGLFQYMMGPNQPVQDFNISQTMSEYLRQLGNIATGMNEKTYDNIWTKIDWGRGITSQATEESTIDAFRKAGFNISDRKRLVNIIPRTRNGPPAGDNPERAQTFENLKQFLIPRAQKIFAFCDMHLGTFGACAQNNLGIQLVITPQTILDSATSLPAGEFSKGGIKERKLGALSNIFASFPAPGVLGNGPFTEEPNFLTTPAKLTIIENTTLFNANERRIEYIVNDRILNTLEKQTSGNSVTQLAAAFLAKTWRDINGGEQGMDAGRVVDRTGNFIKNGENAISVPNYLLRFIRPTANTFDILSRDNITNYDSRLWLANKAGGDNNQVQACFNANQPGSPFAGLCIFITGDLLCFLRAVLKKIPAVWTQANKASGEYMIYIPKDEERIPIVNPVAGAAAAVALAPPLKGVLDPVIGAADALLGAAQAGGQGFQTRKPSPGSNTTVQYTFNTPSRPGASLSPSEREGLANGDTPLIFTGKSLEQMEQERLEQEEHLSFEAMYRLRDILVKTVPYLRILSLVINFYVNVLKSFNINDQYTASIEYSLFINNLNTYNINLSMISFEHINSLIVQIKEDITKGTYMNEIIKRIQAEGWSPTILSYAMNGEKLSGYFGSPSLIYFGGILGTSPIYSLTGGSLFLRKKRTFKTRRANKKASRKNKKSNKKIRSKKN